MGTEAKRASPSNDLISLTTTDRFELLLASTTNTNISVSWKNLAQYLRTLSLPPTENNNPIIVYYFIKCKMVFKMITTK